MAEQMEGQLTLTDWLQWKEDIRRKLQETAENFVYIGYRLKQIRDTKAYKLAGTEDLWQFAQQEYGLSRSVVSRFMAINDKFSEGGNGIELRGEFRGLGYSKLQEMLQLPEESYELVTGETTVAQIRELKQFEKESAAAGENPEEPVNTECGGDSGIEEREWSPLEKCIIDFFSTRREMLEEVTELMKQEPGEETEQKICEAINPNGVTNHKKGTIFLLFYDHSTGVKYKTFGKIQPDSMTWTEFISILADIFGPYVENERGVWAEFYKPEKAAPYQSECGFEPCATSHKNDENISENAHGEGTGNTEPEADELDEEVTEAAGVPEELNPYERPPRTGGTTSQETTTWKEPPEKKERKPIEPPPVDAEYLIPVGKTMIGDIRKGQRYLILKMQQPYRVGNTLLLQEHSGGESTGKLLKLGITHLTDDHGGITPGYCVIQFEILPEPETQLPGQLEFGDMISPETEEENEDEETGCGTYLPEEWEKDPKEEE